MFKKVIYCLVILQVFSCQTPSKEHGDNSSTTLLTEREIQLAYTNYKEAVKEGNGTQAIKFVSKNTIRYYNSLIEMVKYADSTKLSSADLLLKFNVLAIRHTVDWKMLRAMEGETLFSFAIENGTIGKETIASNIGKITLLNDSLAKSEFIMNNKETGKYINFYKESGTWKVDLIALLDANENQLKQMLAEYNLSEDQNIILLLSKAFGNKPGPEVWQPATTNAK